MVITSTRDTEWKPSLLKTQNVLRKTNSESFSSFFYFSKCRLSKAKITRFEKMSFEFAVTEINK